MVDKTKNIQMKKNRTERRDKQLSKNSNETCSKTVLLMSLAIALRLTSDDLE